MKRVMLVVIMIAAGFAVATANPLPPFSVSEISTSPPWIELVCETTDDLSGIVVHTMGGDAVIDSGVHADIYHMLVLDSSNTSGFALNTEGDSIVIADMYIDIGFGCKGRYAVPPVAGESAEWTHWHNGELNFSVDTSPGGWAESPACAWGQTEVVINEITPWCSWIRDCRFIELYNRSTAPLDIGGWQIICDNRHYIPLGTVLPAHGYYALDEWLFPGGFDLTFNCDNVYLLNAAEQLVDQVGWSSNHGENVSFMRYPNGGPDSMTWYQYTGFDDATSIGFSEGFPTRAAANRPESPGLKVIGARFEYTGDRVNLYWTDPIWLATYDQTILRKSLTGFPQTPFDGDLIFEGRDQQYLYDYIPPGQTAYYTAFARTSCGEYSIPDSEAQVSILSPVGVADERPLPQGIALLECYPNPFNASVMISFTTAEPVSAELAIYNIAGQRVAALADGEMTAGEHRVTWHAAGQPSGIYFARLTSGGRSGSVKMVLLQ